jgi:ribosome-associated toxin RatA of RatAB toxin-antitoxin module
MRELSPYEHVNAPHVEGYFHTLDARFTITPLANGKTRLSLATHHELDLEPALYWVPIAEWITHANKMRVLTHFRDQAEANGSPRPG